MQTLVVDCCTPHQPEGVCPSQPVFLPSHLGGKQVREGGAGSELGPKPKPSPRGGAAKAKEQKSLCADAQATD